MDSSPTHNLPTCSPQWPSCSCCFSICAHASPRRPSTPKCPALSKHTCTSASQQPLTKVAAKIGAITSLTKVAELHVLLQHLLKRFHHDGRQHEAAEEEQQPAAARAHQVINAVLPARRRGKIRSQLVRSEAGRGGGLGVCPGGAARASRWQRLCCLQRGQRVLHAGRCNARRADSATCKWPWARFCLRHQPSAGWQADCAILQTHPTRVPSLTGSSPLAPSWAWSRPCRPRTASAPFLSTCSRREGAVLSAAATKHRLASRQCGAAEDAGAQLGVGPASRSAWGCHVRRHAAASGAPGRNGLLRRWHA